MSFFSYNRAVGVDFSDYSIELLCLEKSFFKPKLYAYNRCIIPAGIMADGKILNSIVVSELLKKMLREAQPNPMTQGYCVISLPDSQVYCRILHLPAALSGKNLRQAVLHEINRKFPTSLEDIYYDFKVICQTKDAQEIIFIAALHSIVDDYVEILHEAGLMLLAIDIESLSIGRALLHNKDTDKSVCIADIGARYTNISLYKKNNVTGIFLIPAGGDRITYRIARELFLLSNEAEEKKKSIGLTFSGNEYSVSEIIADELKEVIREIKKIIQYYLYKRKEIIETIVLAGGCALMPDIKKFFQSHFWQEVEIRNPLEKILLHPDDIKNGRKVLFANAIGLALRGVHNPHGNRYINLLEKARRYED